MTTSGKQLATLIVRWPGTAGNETTSSTPPLPPLLLLFTRISLRSAAKKLNMSLALSGPLLSNARIDLQVGERCSTTLASTLPSHHDHLCRWEDSPSADGSYFIDADPDLLSRRKVTGLTHAFYKTLQEEAEDFGIAPMAHPTEGSQGERT